MTEIITKFTDSLTSFASQVPLPLFTFFGALIEEIIAPIPSPVVMTLAGSLASAANQNWFYLILLALTGSIGKTIGAYVIYYISDKAEDIVISKFGKFIGVSEKDVEKISKKLNSGTRDDLVLFLLRAIPIVPTAPVSVVCGLIKTNLKTYIYTTFLGTLVRNVFYLYLGFTSLNALESLNSEIDTFEKVGYGIVLVLVGIIFAYIYRLKKKQEDTN
jgi:membrane protein DedA with SNARE-associated domain